MLNKAPESSQTEDRTALDLAAEGPGREPWQGLHLLFLTCKARRWEEIRSHIQLGAGGQHVVTPVTNR